MSKSAENREKLRDLPDDELAQALARIRDELFRTKLGMQMNQIASTASVGTKRREIAQIMTVQRGRTLGLEKQKAKAKASEGAQAAKKSQATTKTTKKKAKKEE
jgi:ribosomal protein L29